MAKDKRRTREEFRFVIDAYSPATMPMERLGQYLTELAKLLGDVQLVHFRELLEGSTVAVAEVEHEAIPKVLERVHVTRSRGGPPDAMQAFKAINRLLREDNATGSLGRKHDRRPLLSFAGKLEAVSRTIVTHRHGTVDGKLVRIGGTDQTIHAVLQSEGQQLSGIHMDEAVAKRLAPLLLEYVRLEGSGRWERDSDGRWTLTSFRVQSFQSLDTAPLTAVLEKIRKVGTGWSDDTAYDELTHLRSLGDPDESD